LRVIFFVYSSLSDRNTSEDRTAIKTWMAGASPAMTWRGVLLCDESTRLGELAVAVLELLTGAARTQLVAADLAPA
jgi:hypothetical protein